LFIHVLTVCVLFVVCSSLAHAQATRTWVSGVGDDANPCSRTAPCKTFAGAISKTAPGGEINVLDPGGFGAVTITKSITISSEGFEAGVLVSGTNGIVISGGSVIVLRGLDFQGLGTGLSAIKLLTPATLFIEKCTIDSFTTGIDIEPSGGASQVFITDTIVRNNGFGASSTAGGILFQPAGGTVIGSLDNVRSESNVFGVKVEDNSTVTIKNSIASGNDFAGFSAVQTASGPITLMLDHSAAVSNGTAGVQSHGTTGNVIVFITNVTTTGNATGLLNFGVGQIVSFKTNNNAGNTTNGAPTSSPGQM